MNTELIDSPEMINDDPYTEGWIVRIKPSKKGEMRTLMRADEYEEHVKETSEDEEEEAEEEDEDKELEIEDEDDEE